jgi:thymidylate kinase
MATQYGRGFTVALIGADGAGKTTVARLLETELRLPVKYMYMGVNWEASNHMLPTTRLVHAIRKARGSAQDTGGPPPPPGARPPRQRFGKRVLRAMWSALSLANRIAEETYRHAIAWTFVRRGAVVVFDRHFLSDYHAHDVAAGRRTFGQHLHGFFITRVLPQPDLVVFLDAPPELLFARKGEGTIEALERRRHDYRNLADSSERVVTVHAGRPLEEVVGAVAAQIRSFAGRRTANAEP